MERKLLDKMIKKSFLQYERNLTIDPLTEKEYERLYEKICHEKETQKTTEWYEIIEDVVYDYITNK
ncbi:YqzH family protein [Bacillus sp. FJAT-47783]|uniref:YqzH family protein n=1 Tax=Bacillus sp. FJAT-47783 TaxID=2922712 RepID=UPI001FABDAEC|nr:YqzH family protein [Bacillus sp. FJAT-47783]